MFSGEANQIGSVFLSEEACATCGCLHGENLRTFGTAWGDVDGDLFPDLYANHHGGTATAPATLYMNLGDAENSTKIVVPTEGDQHGAVFADIDQDGDQDIFEVQGGGRGQATDPAEPRNVNHVFLNQDGAIDGTDIAPDLGITYAQGRGRAPTALNLDGEFALFEGTSARDDGTFVSALFARDRRGDYTEDGARFGVDLNGVVGAVAAHLGGADDHRLDLVMTYGRNRVAVVEGSAEGYVSTFLDETATERVQDVVVFDADGDGDFEIFLARGGAAGDFTESLFDYDEAADAWVDVSVAAGFGTLAQGSHSAVAGDFDNDGDVDIAVYVNGVDRALTFTVWENDGAGVFTPEVVVDAANTGNPDAVAMVDYNLDGALDLLFSDGQGFGDVPDDGGYALLSGDAPTGNWLEIDLEGVFTERDGLGARVYVLAGGEEQVRGQYGGASLTAQSHQRLHFGLGDETEAEVRIVWADGYEQSVGVVAANQVLVIEEERVTVDAQIWNRYSGLQSAVPGAAEPQSLFDEIFAHAADGAPDRASANRLEFDGPAEGQLLRLNGTYELDGETVVGGTVRNAILIVDGQWVGVARDLFWDLDYFFEAAAEPEAAARLLDRTPIDYFGAPGLPDVIGGSNGADVLVGARGADTFIASLGADLIRGTGGIDAIQYNTAVASGGVVVDLEAETSTIRGRAEVATVRGVENLIGGGGDDDFFGDALDNRFFGNGGRDRMQGRDGDDVLKGRGGDDVLKGQMGDDILEGGQGSDFLAGGVGADRFVFLASEANNVATDKISDFTIGEDQIRFRGVDQTEVAFSQDGDVGVLTLGQLIIRLPDIDATTLEIGADVIFV